MNQDVLDSAYTSLPPWEKLLWLMKRLRGPGGCHWDREQTHLSLCENLTEECGELLEAIGSGSDSAIREELGDVLLQTVFHACIAEEEGRFSIDDVLETLCGKIVRRHPHVFGGAKADSAEEAIAQWKKAKMLEKATMDGA